MGEELSDHSPKKIPNIPSFPKASNEWGFAGSSCRGPTIAFSVIDAASFREHVASASELPFPIANGFRVLPLDTQEAIHFNAE